jgi:hypothetical protein
MCVRRGALKINRGEFRQFRKEQIARMRELQKKCPEIKGMDEDIADAEASMRTAETLASNDAAAMYYWNIAARRWHQKPVSPAPPLPPNSTPPVLTVNRNRGW